MCSNAHLTSFNDRIWLVARLFLQVSAERLPHSICRFSWETSFILRQAGMNRSEGFRIQFFLLEGMHPELRFLAICIPTSYDSGKCFSFPDINKNSWHFCTSVFIIRFNSFCSIIERKTLVVKRSWKKFCRFAPFSPSYSLCKGVSCVPGLLQKQNSFPFRS